MFQSLECLSYSYDYQKHLYKITYAITDTKFIEECTFFSARIDYQFLPPTIATIKTYQSKFLDVLSNLLLFFLWSEKEYDSYHNVNFFNQLKSNREKIDQYFTELDFEKNYYHQLVELYDKYQTLK